MTFKTVILSEKPLIIPIFIPHLGCKFKCSFCNQNAVSGKEMPQQDDIEKTVDSYLSWSKKRKITELSFFGGSFTDIPKKFMDFYIEKGRNLVEEKKIDRLRCSTRPDAISREISDLLKNNYFHTIELGVQTFSETLLKKMNRPTPIKSIETALNLLRRNGLKVVFQLMSGFPDETERDIDITIEYLKNLKPDAIRIYPFVPLKETEIFKKLNLKQKNLVSTEIVLNRSAKIFLETQKMKIPTIRIGLPLEKDIPKIYPDNLAQVVVAKAFEMMVKKGEKEFFIQKSFETPFFMTKKKYPEILAHEIR